MKTDCFAYDTKYAGDCSALKTADCRKGKCKFYKTQARIGRAD